MPIYEYRCRKCGAEFEELVLRASDEAELRCPVCGAGDAERRMSCCASVSGQGAGAPAPAPAGGCGGGAGGGSGFR